MRHPWAATLASTLLLLTAALRPAHAAWPRDAFNGNVPICTAIGLQVDPMIVSDGAGGAIITWYDQRSGVYDIYAQRISAAGTPLWTANGVALCTATNIQSSPRIVSDGAGGAIVTWYDLRSGTSYDIYAQRINAAGVVQWTANGVPICILTSSQQYPRMVSDGSGGAIICWEDFRNGSFPDVYAQRINGAGLVQWTASGVAISTATLSQRALACVSDGSGGAIIGWEDDRASTNIDIYAQRINSAGTVQWTANGLGVSTAANDQESVDVLADGAGGAIIAWEDNRGGSTRDIYAQRVNATGGVQWTSNGVAVTTLATSEDNPKLATDGSGGAIITWLDSRSGLADIYSQRISGAGAVQWAANGVSQCTATGTQNNSNIIADGSGGAIVLWNDPRDDAGDVYAQRMSAAGVAQWPSNGAAISTANSSQLEPTAVSDGAGGAIITWYDLSNGNYDIYAQRIERYGQLGNPEPTITSVSDVKNDQGGSVKLTWSASYLDADPTYGITEYRVFRSVPGPVVSSMALSRGATTESDEAVSLGKLLARPAAVGVTSWEYVGSHTAETFALYSRVVATTADSVGGSNPRTAFMVEARASTSISSDRWFSAPDSGYSVDNLPPAAPAPLTGQYLAGATTLHWNRNTEADLAGYRLYRGSSVAFVPGPANLVSALPDTGTVDAAGAPYVYKLTAVDSHGNESPVATLVPTGTTGVGDGLASSELLFAPASPNPASRGTTLRFSLPAGARVSLGLYDAAGRLVREVTRGALPAGDHAATWDLRDGDGRAVRAGLYFARLEVGGRTLVRRVVVTR